MFLCLVRSLGFIETSLQEIALSICIETAEALNHVGRRQEAGTQKCYIGICEAMTDAKNFLALRVHDDEIQGL